MATTTMIFKRNDNVHHSFSLPIDDYEVGTELFFGAKEVIDDDTSDTLAVLKKTFTDSDVSLTITTATWSMSFEPSDTASISFSDGSDEKHFKGEFQLVRPTKGTVSYPDKNNYIDVIVYADVNVRVS